MYTSYVFHFSSHGHSCIDSLSIYGNISSKKNIYTEVDPALCTSSGVVVARRSCLLSCGLNESRTVSLALPLA